MGFAGNLSTLSLAEVFQTINRIRATGVLRLASPNAGRDVVFADGEIIGVAFRGGEERQALLRRLILEGKIDATSAAAISSSGKESFAVMEALIQRGLMTADGVSDAIARQSEERALQPLHLGLRDFVFQDATVEDTFATQLVDHCRARPLRLSVSSLLMEAARRMDEWSRLREVIPGGDAVMGVADGRQEDLDREAAAYPLSAIVPLIDAVRTIDDIVRDSVATRLDVYGALVEAASTRPDHPAQPR